MKRDRIRILAGKGGYLLIDPREFAFGTLAGGLVDEFYGTASPLQNAEPWATHTCTSSASI